MVAGLAVPDCEGPSTVVKNDDVIYEQPLTTLILSESS